MRLPRFTVRTMIVVVAASAIACFAEQMARTSLDRQRIAEFHSATAGSHSWFCAGLPSTDEQRRQLKDARDRWARSRHGRMARYHSALATKYRRAVFRPWIPVAPDPPPP